MDQNTNEEDFSKLGLNEKLSHKHWKARAQGYEALKLRFEQAFESEVKVFAEYDSAAWKTFLSDTNAAAQEKALDAFLVWLEKAKDGAKTASVASPILVEKCFLSTKASARQKASEVLLMYVELENSQPGIEVLSKVIKTHKNPKLITQSLTCLYEMVTNFGPKVLPLPLVLKTALGAFDHADKNVRGAAFNILVELFRWLGEAVGAQLGDLRPVQRQELETIFEKVKAEKRPMASRKIRSEQNKPESDVRPSSRGGDNNTHNNNNNKDEDEEAGEMDAFDLAEPVDIFGKIAPEALAGLHEQKWVTKHDALAQILKAATVVRIAPTGQISDLVKTLQKLVVDINANVNTRALQVIVALTKGLRGQFPWKLVLPTMLLKYKEKKASIVEPITEGLLTMYQHRCFTLPEILPELSENLKNKVPAVRENTMNFVSQALGATKGPAKTAVVKAIKDFSEFVLLSLEDSVEAVRTAGAKSLALISRFVPEKTAQIFLTKVEKVKLAKVEEFIKAEAGTPAAATNPSEPAKEPSSSGSSSVQAHTITAHTTKAQPAASYLKSTSGRSALPPKIPKAQKPAAEKPKKSTVSNKKTKSAAATESAAAPVVEDSIPTLIDPEMALEQVPDLVGAELVQKLSSAKWSERKEAVEELGEWVKKQPDLQKETCNILFRQIEAKPSFKDIPQVQGAIFNFIATLAESCNKLCKGLTVLAIPQLVEKLSDTKLKPQATNALLKLAEAHSFGFVVKEIFPLIAKHKNPKVTQEGILWIAAALEEFHLVPSFPVKDTIGQIKTFLDIVNPTVRTAASKLACVLRKFVGPTLLDFFGDLKGPKLTALEKDFSKVGDATGSPTRFSRDEPQAASGSAASSGLKADLLPREDLAAKVQNLPQLIQNLAEGALKDKRAALEEIEQGLVACHKRINPNVPSDLMNVLKARLNDNTALLVVSTLDLLGSLFTSMGNGGAKHVKNVFPAVVTLLSRNQKNIKDAAQNAMEACVKQVTLEPLVEHIKPVLTGVPTARKDLLAWLFKQASQAPQDAALKELIKPTLSCLEDKSADTRKVAEALLRVVVGTMSASETARYTSDPKILALASQKPPTKQPVAASASSSHNLNNNNNNNNTAAKTGLTKNTASEIPKPTTSAKTNAKPTLSGAAVRTKSSAPASSTTKRAATTSSATTGRASSGSSTTSTASHASKTTGSPAKSTSATMTGPGPEAPLFVANKQKEVRFKKASKLKPWLFENDRPDPEQVESVKRELQPYCNEGLLSKLFSRDFNKHVEGMDSTLEFLQSNEQNAAAVFDNLDLVFKWVTFRLIENNTAVLKKTLQLLLTIFEQFDEQNEILTDPEAMILLPFLVEKAGTPNDTIKGMVHDMFRTLSRVYPDSKLFKFIFEGIHSKNSKTRAECLDELGLIFERQGLAVCIKSKILPQIAERLGDRDQAVRNAATSCLAIVFSQIGAEVMQYVSEPLRPGLQEKLEKSQPQTPAKLAPPSVSHSNTKQPLSSAKRSASGLPATPSRTSTAGSKTPKSTPLRSGIPKPSASAVVGHSTKSGAATPSKASARPTGSGAVSASSSSFSLNLHQDLDDDDFEGEKSEVESLSSFRSMASNRSVVQSPWVEKVRSGDVEALKVLCMSDDDTVFMLDSGALVDALTFHVAHSLSGTSSEAVPWRLYKYTLNTLHRIFRDSAIARCVAAKPLHALVKQLVLAAVNPLLQGEDEKVILKATNQLLAKVLDNADTTDVFTILLQILGDAVPLLPNAQPDPRLLGLVIKCLLTLTRVLKTSIDKVNLKFVLRDLHRFLENHPPEKFKGQSEKDSMPLMAIKTVISEIVSAKREQVFDYMELIPKEKPSAVQMYVAAMLRQNPATCAAASPSKSSVAFQLTSIFKKIAQNKEQGLLDLYHFKKANPSVNIDNYMAGSERFQTIIRRGLAEIEKRNETIKRAPSEKPLSLSERFGLLEHHSTEASEPGPTLGGGSATTSSLSSSANASVSTAVSSVAKPHQDQPLKDLTNTKNATPLSSGSVLSPSASKITLSNLRERLNQIDQQTQPRKEGASFDSAALPSPSPFATSQNSSTHQEQSIENMTFVSNSASDLKERLARLKAKITTVSEE